MRFRFDLPFAAALILLCYGVTWHLARAYDGGPVVGDKCGGNTHCMVDPCITHPPDGYSCAEVEPIEHKQCGPGSQDDCCLKIQVPCAKIVFYGGGGCEGDPGRCPNNDDPAGEATRKEDGCDLDIPCPDKDDPADPGGGA